MQSFAESVGCRPGEVSHRPAADSHQRQLSGRLAASHNLQNLTCSRFLTSTLADRAVVSAAASMTSLRLMSRRIDVNLRDCMRPMIFFSSCRAFGK